MLLPFHPWLPSTFLCAANWPRFGMCWDLFGATFTLTGQLAARADWLASCCQAERIVLPSTITVLYPTPTCINPIHRKTSTSVGLDQVFQKLLVIQGKEGERGRSYGRAGWLSSRVSLEGKMRNGFEGDWVQGRKQSTGFYGHFLWWEHNVISPRCTLGENLLCLLFFFFFFGWIFFLFSDTRVPSSVWFHCLYLS